MVFSLLLIFLEFFDFGILYLKMERVWDFASRFYYHFYHHSLNFCKRMRWRGYVLVLEDQWSSLIGMFFFLRRVISHFYLHVDDLGILQNLVLEVFYCVLEHCVSYDLHLKNVVIFVVLFSFVKHHIRNIFNRK